MPELAGDAPFIDGPVIWRFLTGSWPMEGEGGKGEGWVPFVTCSVAFGTEFFAILVSVEMRSYVV